MLCASAKHIKLQQHAYASSDACGYCSALHAHSWKRTPAKDKNRIQNKVHTVGQPKNSHRDGGIPSSSEYCIDDKDENDDGIAGEDAGGVLVCVRNAPGV